MLPDRPHCQFLCRVLSLQAAGWLRTNSFFPFKCRIFAPNTLFIPAIAVVLLYIALNRCRTYVKLSQHLTDVLNLRLGLVDRTSQGEISYGIVVETRLFFFGFEVHVRRLFVVPLTLLEPTLISGNRRTSGDGLK